MQQLIWVEESKKHWKEGGGGKAEEGKAALNMYVCVCWGAGHLGIMPTLFMPTGERQTRMW